ncbi:MULTISPECIES: hypothetical protein [unclassified Caballeronia]|uniref:hypothetical protein n=1 Tax=unclassified Caballeronia TaxID=2646786 RepID=UPI00202772AF|nr:MULTISPECIES: hypothetical protein [unclassified Caballeronia]
MSRRSRSHAQTQPTAFFPTQAYLGYPEGYQQEPSLRQRRREYADFSRKLRAVFAPLLLNRYALLEHMMVQTSLGFSGGAAGADCVAVTRFGVFVITHIRSVGTLSLTTKANELLVTESATEHAIRCPLWQAAPVVHFLSALLADIKCPVEAIAITTEDACKIDFDLPPSIMKLHELDQFLRQRYAPFVGVQWSFFDVNQISARIRQGCRDWDKEVAEA